MEKIKYAIMMLLMAGLLIFGAVSYAQTLNDWEKGVFQDLVEIWHNKLYELPEGEDLTMNDFKAMYRQVAKKYNINAKQVEEIDNRGLDDLSDLGDAEYILFGEFRRRLQALPASATAEDSEKMHSELANEKGISLYRLHWIEYKMYEGI